MILNGIVCVRLVILQSLDRATAAYRGKVIGSRLSSVFIVYIQVAKVVPCGNLTLI